MAALVTGGALRLGRQICLSLAESGIPVVIHCKRSLNSANELKHTIEKLGGRASVVNSDLEDSARSRVLIEEAASSIGCNIDILVNNASIFEHDVLDNITEDSFRKHMTVNLLSPMQLSASLVEHARARRDKGEIIGRGRLNIVNILDQKLENPNPDHMSYTMSKYGLAGMSDTLARSLAHDGIRCNSVSPGFVLENEGDNMGPEALAAAQAASPLGYGPCAQDVAEAVVFLAKPSAKSVTGTTIYVDSGERFNARSRDVAFDSPA